MRASKRDTLVTFERAVETANDYNEVIETFVPVGSEYAEVLWGTGSERREAAAEGGAQPATFKLRSTTSTRAVIVTDRLLAFGGVWDILGIAPMGRRDIHFTALRPV